VTRLPTPRADRIAEVTSAMEKRDQAYTRYQLAEEHAGRVTRGTVRGGSIEAVAAAERAVTADYISYQAACVELAELLLGDTLPPVPPLLLAVI
jgi:hypothetical protein